MQDKTEIILNDIKEAMKNARKIGKVLAKMYNTKEYINRMQPLQRLVQNLFSDLFYENTEAYKKHSNKLNKFNSDMDNYWFYCQGDSRIKI